MAQMVKSLHTMQETWVWFLSWKDPLEVGLATLSSILAWKIPWQRRLVGYSPWRHIESDTTEWLTRTSNNSITSYLFARVDLAVIQSFLHFKITFILFLHHIFSFLPNLVVFSINIFIILIYYYINIAILIIES